MYKTTIAYDVKDTNDEFAYEHEYNLHDVGDEVKVIAKLFQSISVGVPSRKRATACVVMQNITKGYVNTIESVQVLNVNIDDLKDVPLIGDASGDWDEIAKKELDVRDKTGSAPVYAIKIDIETTNSKVLL